MIREPITGENAQYYSTLAPSHKHSGLKLTGLRETWPCRLKFWHFNPPFQNKMLSLKGKTGYFKVLGKSKRKGIVQIAYFLKNMHRTYVVQYHIATNQEQISGFWGSPILSSPLSTRKWLNPMIQSRLSSIARSYFQDLIYICHTQQGSFDHTYLDRQQADFPWK